MSLLLCYEQRIPLFVTELLSGLTSVQSVLRYLRGGGELRSLVFFWLIHAMSLAYFL